MGARIVTLSAFLIIVIAFCIGFKLEIKARERALLEIRSLIKK